MNSAPNRSNRLASVVAIALIGAALSACGGSTDEADDVTSTSAHNAAPDGGAGALIDDTPDVDENAEWYSPINVYVQAVWGGHLSPEQQQAQWEENELRRQELIAQCMRDQGWDYIPHVGGARAMAGGASVYFGGPRARSSGHAAGVDWRPNDRDWVEEWGFGIIRNPWAVLLDSNAERVDDDPNAGLDPNWVMIQDWPEAEQAAWNESLWGPTPNMADFETDEYGNPVWEWNPEDAGCSGWAHLQMGGRLGSFDTEEFAPLFEAIEDFWATLHQRPEFTELIREWSQCMAGKGQPGLTEQWDAQAIIHRLIDEIWTTLDWRTTWDWERDGDPMHSDEVAALLPLEIEVALQDWECRIDTDQEGRLREYTFRAEQQFVSEHHAALRALRAAAEQAG